jgi:hypothetical protein
MFVDSLDSMDAMPTKGRKQERSTVLLRENLLNNFASIGNISFATWQYGRQIARWYWY